MRRKGYAKVVGKYIQTNDSKYENEDERKELYYPTFSYTYKGNKYTVKCSEAYPKDYTWDVWGGMYYYLLVNKNNPSDFTVLTGNTVSRDKDKILLKLCMMIILTCVFILIGIFVKEHIIYPNGVYNITRDKPTHISCEIKTYQAFARIDIKDSYTLDGETYYILSFKAFDTNSNDTLYKSPQFKLSESEYDKYFGTGNDAFNTTIYELNCETTIYSDYCKKCQSEASEGITECKYKKITDTIWANDEAEITSIGNHSEYYAKLTKYRFSIFDENDFSANDKKEAEEQLITVGMHYVSKEKR